MGPELGQCLGPLSANKVNLGKSWAALSPAALLPALLIQIQLCCLASPIYSLEAA